MPPDQAMIALVPPQLTAIIVTTTGIITTTTPGTSTTTASSMLATTFLDYHNDSRVLMIVNTTAFAHPSSTCPSLTITTPTTAIMFVLE